MFNQDYYTRLLNKLSFPNDVREAFIDYVKQHEKSIQARANHAYEGEAPHYPVCDARPWQRLCIVLFKLKEVEEAFQKNGIPEAVFIETCKDITLRYEIYHQKNQKMGLSKDDALWFRHIFHIHIFKLGVLQFQMFHMVYLDKAYVGFEYMRYEEEQYQRLPANTPVINVHVQKGADLTPAKVEASFVMAKQFFARYFPAFHPKAFLCYSWLLCSGNKELLPPDANILAFARMFDIIAENHERYEAVKRIYGKHYRKKSQYPQNTTLQRNAIDHMSLLGEGCGVRYI